MRDFLNNIRNQSEDKNTLNRDESKFDLVFVNLQPELTEINNAFSNFEGKVEKKLPKLLRSEKLKRLADESRVGTEKESNSRD